MVVNRKVAAAVVIAAVSAVAASAGAAGPPTGICTTLVHGPKVTIAWVGPKATSHLYYAMVSKYGCAGATKYTRQFVGRRSPGLQVALSGGPRGFRCLSLAPKGYTVFQGACKTTSKRQSAGFVWALKYG